MDHKLWIIDHPIMDHGLQIMDYGSLNYGSYRSLIMDYSIMDQLWIMDYRSFKTRQDKTRQDKTRLWIMDHLIMDHFNSMIMDYGSFNHIDYHIGSYIDHTGSYIDYIMDYLII